MLDQLIMTNLECRKEAFGGLNLSTRFFPKGMPSFYYSFAYYWQCPR